MPTSNAALISRRAASLPGNPFAEADARAAAAVAAGKDIIDLSKGNPDGWPPSFVQDALSHASHNPSLFRYPPFDGLPEYLNAIAGWYSRQHNVTVDPATQLLATSGSSVGITTVIQALVDPGDTVVAVDPYYPQYEGSTVVAGGQFETIPADPSRGFLPDLDAVDPALWTRAKLLILNYPNNPTGAQAPREFLERAIELAHEHRFVIVQDFAYAGLGVRNQQISILSLPDAFDVTVEVCSLSKMYAMAGWRAGFIAGNDDIVSHVKQYHYQMGSMVTGNVQDAGTVALQSDQECVAELASRYALRRQIVADGLRDAGLDVFDSDGGIYAWVHAPEGLTGERFADLLLERAAVAALPGTCFGKVGVDYVRFSLLKSEDQLREAVRRIAAVL